MSKSILEERAILYAAKRQIGLDLRSLLGFGQDGYVWKSNRKTAVKAIERQSNYISELTCYQRFKEHGITKLHGLSIPQLIDHDDELQVVEMRIVTAPYLLDFAKAWIDKPADFSDETLQTWEQDSQEMFESRWPDVLSILASLAALGIYYYDVKPANIKFTSDDD